MRITGLILVILSVIIAVVFFHRTFGLSGAKHGGVFITFILVLRTIIFCVLCTRVPASLGFFTVGGIRRRVLNFSVGPIDFRTLGPF